MSGGAAGTALVAATATLVAVHLVTAWLVHREMWEPSLYAATLEGVPYALVIWLVMSGRASLSLRTILLVAVGLRLVSLGLDPYFSSDMFRYVWEGRIQAAGFSPYLHVPADAVLEPYRDAIWEHVNRADYAPTIYPPAAQAFFLLVTRISETVVFMKLAMVACEAIALWAVVRLLDDAGLPRERIVIYAWSPLTVWEIAGNGHVDALMLAFVALALLASRRGRDGLAGVALAAAVMVKFVPLAIAPALWRRWDLKLPLAMAATIALAYAPYVWGAGSGVIGFMGGYATEEGIANGSGFWLMRLLAVAGIEPPLWAYFGLMLAIAAAIAFAAAFLVDRAQPRPLMGYALALATTAIFALSPAFPWYFAWLLAIMCVRPFWPLLWLTTSGYLLYVDYGRSVPLIAAVVYGGTVLLCIAEFVRQARRGATPPLAADRAP